MENIEPLQVEVAPLEDRHAYGAGEGSCTDGSWSADNPRVFCFAGSCVIRRPGQEVDDDSNTHGREYAADGPNDGDYSVRLDVAGVVSGTKDRVANEPA